MLRRPSYFDSRRFAEAWPYIEKPMSRVIAFHVILSNHGFWLPNDPRGSCSKEVRYDPLKVFGEATMVVHARSVAAKSHDRRLRLAAKLAMKYPEVIFT